MEIEAVHLESEAENEIIDDRPDSRGGDAVCNVSLHPYTTSSSSSSDVRHRKNVTQCQKEYKDRPIEIQRDSNVEAVCVVFLTC